jgi:8-oxo-dGTP diphosphatase
MIRANLCFIVRGGEVLLIRKKRGLGAGKINGPGGKIDPGETAMDSAIRETFEELLVTPIGPRQVGELSFKFRDGLRLHCAVFLADDFSGTPTETDEAVPLWTGVDVIPYDEMWADDRYWLPLLLRGELFRGTFEFDGDTMCDHRLEVLPADATFD